MYLTPVAHVLKCLIKVLNSVVPLSWTIDKQMALDIY